MPYGAPIDDSHRNICGRRPPLSVTAQHSKWIGRNTSVEVPHAAPLFVPKVGHTPCLTRRYVSSKMALGSPGGIAPRCVGHRVGLRQVRASIWRKKEYTGSVTRLTGRWAPEHVESSSIVIQRTVAAGQSHIHCLTRSRSLGPGQRGELLHSREVALRRTDGERYG